MIGPVAGPRVFAHSPALLWALCAVLGLIGALSILIGKTAPRER